MKGRVNQEDITIKHTCTKLEVIQFQKNKKTKKLVLVVKTQINFNPLIVVDFNALLFPRDGSCGQKKN